MRRLLLVKLIFFCGMQGAFAAPGQPAKKVRPATKEPASEEAMVSEEDQNSRATRARQRQNYSLVYTPLSDFFLKYGAQMHLIKSPALQLGVVVLTGSEVLASDYEDGSFDAKATGTGVSFHGRYFTGNSFNILAGLGYRAANMQMEFTDRVLGIVEGEVKIRSITIPLFIGNQWTWPGGFTLGVDWIGAWIPISGGSEASFKGDLQDKDLDELSKVVADLGDKLSKTPTYTLLMTSVGIAF